MIVFYNKITGEIIGTREGFQEDDGITIIPGGISAEDIGREVIGVGHSLEQWARDIEDTKKPEISISSHRFDGEKFDKIPQAEIDQEKLERKIASDEFKKQHQKKIDKIKDTKLSDKERLNLLIEYLNI